MDQVKVYLGVAKKHHFWILSVIVVITAVVVWMKAASSLATLYETNKKTIISAEDSVKKANSDDTPNQLFSKKVDGLHDGLKKQVFEAWQKLYERQVGLFRWPKLQTADGEVDLNNYKPDEDIPDFLRTYYNENIVQKQWEAILEEVHIRKPKLKTEEDADDADSERAEKRGVEYVGLVVWKPELRQAIVSRYYTPNATPSTTRLRLMQEDVWLFESLIDVVNTVNAGATDSLKAPIKEIDVLDVAQWAIAASLQSGSPIWTPGSGSGGGPTGMGAGMMTSGAAAGGANAAAAATAGAGAAAPGEADKEWLDGRYLDEKGQPLTGTTQPFAEFRQVFVYMKFIMDQRRIPDLVAACANAPLPIETRQIKVQMLKGDNVMAGSSLFGGGMSAMGGPAMGGPAMGGPAMGGPAMGGPAMGGPAMGGPAMGGPAMGGPAMGGGMGAMGGGMGAMGGAMQEGGGAGFGGVEGGVETTVYDATVELSGVIYLYNPPDLAKLGTGAAGSPEKRSFGVPTTAVHVPGGTGSTGSTGGGMQEGMQKMGVPAAAPTK